MKNFSTMTLGQAYRLLQELWDKLEKEINQKSKTR